MKIVLTSCKTTLFVFFTLFCFSFTLNAATQQLKYHTFGNNFSTNNFQYCDFAPQKSFYGSYSHGSNPSGLGDNRYRYTIRLYKNGSQIKYIRVQLSSSWINWPLYNASAPEGAYYANIKFEVRNYWGQWVTHNQVWTNTIYSYRPDASPNFNINGIPIPSDGSPINVCASYIRINAAGTSCESRYNINVQESNRWWGRTYAYEWGLWFQGTAPNNINLQQLSTTYSVPPHFTGPWYRQGSPLIGGNLPNGQERYYRVSLCTDEPSWNCKSVLLRVNGNCLTDEETSLDRNVYIPSESKNSSQEISSVELIQETENSDNSIELKDVSDLKKPLDLAIQDASLTNFSDIPENLDKISIYPNPAKSFAILKFDLKINDTYDIHLYDLSGKVVSKLASNQSFVKGKNEITINRNNLNDGIYLLRISNDKQVISKKIVFH